MHWVREDAQLLATCHQLIYDRKYALNMQLWITKQVYEASERNGHAVDLCSPKETSSNYREQHSFIKFVSAVSVVWSGSESRHSRYHPPARPLLVRLSGPALLHSGRRGGARTSEDHRYDVKNRRRATLKLCRKGEIKACRCLQLACKCLQRWSPPLPTHPPESAKRKTPARGEGSAHGTGKSTGCTQWQGEGDSDFLIYEAFPGGSEV